MKRSKLFMAFTGDAAGLRDVLIEHFKHEADMVPVPRGDTYPDGIEAGRGMAYHEMVRFLKKLVINNNEHAEPAVSDEVALS